MNNQNHGQDFVLIRLDPRSLITLIQARKTFEGISRLADNIARNGLIEPIGVVEYTDINLFQELVKELNLVWTSRMHVSSYNPLIIDKKMIWRVLNFGERRVKAMLQLYQLGCSACYDLYGKEDPGKCYYRHSPDGCFTTKLYRDLTPDRFLDLQFGENIYDPMPPGELAEGIAAYHTYRLSINKTVTMAQSARELGRDASTIRNSLMFATLPRAIRDSARNVGHYGIALEIARYSEAAEKNGKRLLSRELCDIYNHFLIHKFTLNMAKKYIDEKIGSFNQLELLDIMNQARDQQEIQLKRDLSRKATEFLYQAIKFWSNILTLCRYNKICKKYTPLTEETLLRLLYLLAKVLERVGRRLKNIKPSMVKRAELADKIFIKFQKDIEELLQIQD